MDQRALDRPERIKDLLDLLVGLVIREEDDIPFCQMITEEQLDQLAIQWFQDTGWNHVHGAVIAPEAEPKGHSPRPFASGYLRCARVHSGRRRKIGGWWITRC